MAEISRLEIIQIQTVTHSVDFSPRRQLLLSTTERGGQRTTQLEEYWILLAHLCRGSCARVSKQEASDKQPSDKRRVQGFPKRGGITVRHVGPGTLVKTPLSTPLSLSALLAFLGSLACWLGCHNLSPLSTVGPPCYLSLSPKKRVTHGGPPERLQG